MAAINNVGLSVSLNFAAVSKQQPQGRAASSVMRWTRALMAGPKTPTNFVQDGPPVGGFPTVNAQVREAVHKHATEMSFAGDFEEDAVAKGRVGMAALAKMYKEAEVRARMVAIAN